METISIIPEIGCARCQPIIQQVIKSHLARSQNGLAHLPLRDSVCAHISTVCDSCGVAVAIGSDYTQVIVIVSGGLDDALFRIPR